VSSISGPDGAPHRCAVYTRKSHEEGLEQDFNSLDAQREACEAFIASQKHEGWKLLPNFFDDGGVSGATMERPALNRLLDDVRANRIDVVVVYKVDRLTRSLTDFSKIVDIFDEYGVSFVSVTQQFNTTTSMGRLTLNVLLSFAQFEREVTAERIRDKIAASKKKGLWMGGLPPLGYDVEDHKLVVNETEADQVRHIFHRYVELKSVRDLTTELKETGLISKRRVSQSGRKTGGVPFRRGALYHLLQNEIYLGRIVHKDQSYPGIHTAIIEHDLWKKVQETLASNRTDRRNGKNAKEPSLLAGILFDDQGTRVTPSHAVKKGKRYRYYISRSLMVGRRDEHPKGRRVPAIEIERLVSDHIWQLMLDESAILTAVSNHNASASEQHDILKRINAIAETWSQLDTATRRRILLSLVARVDLLPERLDIHVRMQALAHIDNPDARHDEVQPLMTCQIPARLKRTGMELRMLIDGERGKAGSFKPDRSLVRLVTKAREYEKMVLNSENRSMNELAAAAGVTRSYFTRAQRLAYLAPDIVRAIADGTQPPELTATKLTAVSQLPRDWAKQRTLLGFE